MALFVPILDDHHSLISTILGGNEDHRTRHSLLNDEFLLPLLHKKARRHALHPYNRSLRNTSSTDNKNFTVNIDVQQFSPDEIKVKSVNEDTIVIECKHEEHPDEHGSIYRHFVRSYKIPKGHDVSKSTSKLSSDGVLTITAPKVEKKGKNEIEIPITFTNQPSAIQQAVPEKAESSGESKEKHRK